MQIRSFKEAQAVLDRFIPPKRRPGEKYTLDRMRALMQALGNPQDSYKVIHIAGTSGKTSTAYYVAALLQQTGAKVGLTVSPHIDQINERVQINLKPLPETDFCRAFGEFMDIINGLSYKPTYFELLVAFAYWQFARERVDYAIIEVGLGGLLDGTNVINRDDKVCVITDIGLDHVEVLGNTLADIAAQKAGIILRGNVAFSHKQSDEVMDVFRSVAKLKSATLHEITEPPAKNLPASLPLFQQRNWYLAKQVVDFVIQHDKLSKLTPARINATLRTHIPGRMEAVKVGPKTIIMDGSHNKQKIAALLTSIKKSYPNQKYVFLVSFGQNYSDRMQRSLRLITEMASYIIVTQYHLAQDEVKPSIAADEVARYCRQLGFNDIEIESEPQGAYRALLNRPEKVGVVVGSFYLLNHIRPLIFNKT